ncbi:MULTISPECIES: signal peptidase II [Clostridium]|uniref:Lipoprotein signal peptidase n=2 Tax=Clostridium TaxID=1485 RepID=A0A151AQ72_9CLOT|nr:MULTISPECIES: signal peptidase II [Clostridium]KYH29791.1 lipoprotein signal peptidase [Clostridium colicanis DSM 13634]MBE6044780.1 signal peptidase II [Clostridium thermopalmarium]PRR75172.1 Lipoprotein signal peptidase [Clostridium thermopalmarium DSM 5974]PVZ27928.1 signal peptidase II [Clostridium thermopalmarium DSM 5974]
MEIAIIIIGVLIDRITKVWALKTIRSGNDIVIIKDFFSIQYLENRGAAFGIFQGKTLLLSIVTLIVILAMIYYLIKYREIYKLTRISLALIIGGALGNLYDRIIYKYVVDFIMLHYKDIYYFPTFNIADILVVVGTIALAISILREGK